MTEIAPEPTTEPVSDVDWKSRFEAATAESTKWKEMSRKNEDLAKSNLAAAKRVAELEKQTMTDSERRDAELKTAKEEAAAFKMQTESLAAEKARYEAGLAAGLTLQDLKFIPAGTPEEMKAAAEDLASRLKIAQIPSYDGGGRPPADEPQTFSELIRAAVAQKRGNAS